jgi:hypothetical protein
MIEDAKAILSAFACLAVLLILFYIVCSGYEGLDSEGWLSHQVETTITLQGNWMEGESRLCISSVNKITDYALSSLYCGEGDTHTMHVTFYGREKQPEYSDVFWRCVRELPSSFNDNTFTCYETGGLPLMENKQ